MPTWQSIDTYKPGQTGFFWFDGLVSYAAFGELWRSPMETKDHPAIRRVWWDDVAYGPEDEITMWMPCEPPQPVKH